MPLPDLNNAQDRSRIRRQIRNKKRAIPLQELGLWQPLLNTTTAAERRGFGRRFLRLVKNGGLKDIYVLEPKIRISIGLFQFIWLPQQPPRGLCFHCGHAPSNSQLYVYRQKPPRRCGNWLFLMW